MTIEEVQARLRAAHARIGHEGRFALTLISSKTDEAYLTHWFRPDPTAFEECKAVGSGALTDCLAALERYTAGYHRQPTPEEIGRTLGLIRSAEGRRFLMVAE